MISNTKQKKNQVIIFLLIGVLGIIVLSLQTDILNPAIISVQQVQRLIPFSSVPTFNPINFQIHKYRRVLNMAVSEVTFEKPLSQQLNTDGCTYSSFVGHEICDMNALLYFSNISDRPFFEKRLLEEGWQDKTIRSTMITDADDTYFKTIDGLPLCLSIGKEMYASDYINDLHINIDMIFCPDKNPDPAGAWSGWRPYFPTEIPSRYIVKHSSKDLLDGEITLTYSQKPLKGNFEPYIDIEESKLPSTYNPPNACNFAISYAALDTCPFYLTTSSGYKIYQDSSYNDTSENVFYTAINNTRIVIRKWYEPVNNPLLTDGELEKVVDSFIPVSLQDLQKEIPEN